MHPFEVITKYENYKKEYRKNMKEKNIEVRIWDREKIKLTAEGNKNKSIILYWNERGEGIDITRIQETSYGYLGQQQIKEMCEYATDFIEEISLIKGKTMITVSNMHLPMKEILETRGYKDFHELINPVLLRRILSIPELYERMKRNFTTKTKIDKKEITKLENQLEMLLIVFEVLKKEQEKDITTQIEIFMKTNFLKQSKLEVKIYYKGKEQTVAIKLKNEGTLLIEFKSDEGSIEHIVQTKKESENLIVECLKEIETKMRFIKLHQPPRKHFDDKTDKMLGNLKDEAYHYLKRSYKAQEIEEEMVKKNFNWNTHEYRIDGYQNSYRIHRIVEKYFVHSQENTDKKIKGFETFEEAREYFKKIIIEKVTLSVEKVLQKNN